MTKSFPISIDVDKYGKSKTFLSDLDPLSDMEIKMEFIITVMY